MEEFVRRLEPGSRLVVEASGNCHYVDDAVNAQGESRYDSRSRVSVSVLPSPVVLTLNFRDFASPPSQGIYDCGTLLGHSHTGQRVSSSIVSNRLYFDNLSD